LDIRQARGRRHWTLKLAGAVAAMSLVAAVHAQVAPARAGMGPAAEVSATPPAGHRITLDQGSDRPPVSLYYEEHGAGPPLLLLHGLGESVFTWSDVLPALAARFRVIAIDLKGFGRSDKPGDGAYTADDQAALVAKFLIERGLDGVTVVGHSFGGTVALRTALADGILGTRRISRLAVIGAPALPRAAAGRFELVKLPLVPDALASVLPADAMARLLLREAMGGKADVSDAMVEGYAAPYRETGAMQAFLATARTIVEEDGQRDIAKRYRKLAAPVLVVWCRKDPIVPLRSGRKLVAALPRAKLAMMQGCHHLPQHEKPAELAKLIGTFAETGRFP
jgi:pimeloyl-ACP methyl ester carboxylesterase